MRHVSAPKPDSRPVEIDLMGRTFTVRSDNSPERIEEIVGLVNQRLREIQTKATTLPADRIALLACLTLAEELVSLRHENATLKDAVAEQATEMLGALDDLQEQVGGTTESLGLS